jgi:hypothetical protein
MQDPDHRRNELDRTRGHYRLPCRLLGGFGKRGHLPHNVFFSNMGFENVGAPKKSKCDWVCSPMVGQFSGTLPARVQIMVLAPFPGFSRIYRCYALSGKRRSHRRRGATVTSGISRSAGAQSFRGAHRGRVLRTCIHRGECACVL